MLRGAFHPTSLKEPGQEAVGEIWMHLSQWKFSSWLPRANLHCSTCGGSVHCSDYTTFLVLRAAHLPCLYWVWSYSLCDFLLSPLQLEVPFSCGAVVSASTYAAEIKVAKFLCLFKQASGLGTIFLCVEMKYFISEKCHFKPKLRARDASNRILIYTKKERHFKSDCAHLRKLHQPLDTWEWYW